MPRGKGTYGKKVGRPKKKKGGMKRKKKSKKVKVGSFGMTGMGVRK